MNIGTPGAAYGPGFAVSRPTLGAGTPLDGGRGSAAVPMRPLRLPVLTPTKFSPDVHHNEIANRVSALRLAQHPLLTGMSQSQSPLLAAHQALTAPAPSVATPPPLMSLSPMETPAPMAGNVGDLLRRAQLARRGTVA